MKNPTESDANKSIYPCLVPFPTKSNSQPISLGPSELTVGRAPSNTLELSHGGVSRVHARISHENGQHILTDLESRNGTYLNNKRINQATLSHNDKIFFGNRGFIFLTEPAELAHAPSDIDLDGEDTVTISEDEIELSELVANSANVAAHNFLEPSSPSEKIQAQQAHKRLSLLYQLSESLRTAKDADEILDKGLELVFKALPSAGRAAAMLKSETTGSLEVRAVRYRDQNPDECVIPVSRPVIDRVVKDQVAVVSGNVAADSRFEDSESIVIQNIESFICVPLFIGKNVMGAIHIDTKDYDNPFVQNDMEFTAAVSNELALSIENCRLQKEAIKNEKMVAIGMTITNLAHNIKNLVTINANTVDMMDDHLKTIKDENLQKNWRFVSQGLERIATLTADMLEYTQNDPVDLKPIDVNATILSECEMFKENLASEDIELELDLAPKLPRWKINEFRLQRALLNLIVNAKDALTGKKGGCIKISTVMEDNQRLVIRVSDDGCGIYKDKLKKIFELFYTSKGMDGSGLGLSIVQKFVESLGGTVSVVSQADVGSTFSMVFPKNPGV
jgi:signal transduction histidine kinase/pSer/pThr/pTyr-binding forkhead associated (FHA) protein